MTLTLTIMRGISGSGKSTEAERLRALNPEKTIIVSRDALRLALYNTEFGPPIDENIISYVETTIADVAFKEGVSVISDNTNLSLRNVRALATRAAHSKAKIVIHEVNATVEEAKERNLKRFHAGGRFVPEDIIDRQFQQFIDPLSRELIYELGT